MTAIHDFKLDPAQLQRVGTGLTRPESVVARPDGTLFISDARGLVTRMGQDGQQTLLGQSVGEPNGMAIDTEGRLVIAAMEGGRVLRIGPNGEDETVLLDSFEGAPLGSANHVFQGPKGRLYISVSTRHNPWWPAVTHNLRDGYILLLDDNGPRRIADGINLTNEVRLDREGKYLYAVETMSRHMLRFPLKEDGTLGDREIYGPDDLGHGAYIDGFAFDAEDNLWLTTVTRNGVMIVSPDGDVSTVFEDVNAAGLDLAVAKIEDHTIEPAHLVGCAGPHVQLATSLCFAGPDLRTVYVGSLAMPHLLKFTSPVPGLPMSHWISGTGSA